MNQSILKINAFCKHLDSDSVSDIFRRKTKHTSFEEKLNYVSTNTDILDLINKAIIKHENGMFASVDLFKAKLSEHILLDKSKLNSHYLEFIHNTFDETLADITELILSKIGYFGYERKMLYSSLNITYGFIEEFSAEFGIKSARKFLMTNPNNLYNVLACIITLCVQNDIDLIYILNNKISHDERNK